MKVLENEIMKLELINNSLVRNYFDLVGKREEIVLKNIPKNEKSRIKLLEKIEDKASSRTYTEQQQESYNSLYNRYYRQWVDLATLIYGYNKDFNKPNVSYNFGDVIA